MMGGVEWDYRLGFLYSLWGLGLGRERGWQISPVQLLPDPLTAIVTGNEDILCCSIFCE